MPMKYTHKMKEYFKKHGVQTLEAKIKSSIRFYNDKKTKYPFNQIMLGFPAWTVKSREELKGRIIELAHLLGANLSEETEVEKTTAGEKRWNTFQVEFTKLEWGEEDDSS